MKKAKKEYKKREAPEYKKKQVAELAEKIKKAKTIFIASSKGLPGGQFHLIKKRLRGKAELYVAKKNIVLKAISASKKGDMELLNEFIGADKVLLISDLDAFELSGELSDNQTPTKAKAGNIAPEDIRIEPGPTELIPGPAISELSGVGLKVAVENGKLTIKQGAVVAKKGEAIKENVAGVLAKLNILPMKVGFEPIAAYDSKSNKIYTGLKIDKEKTLEELREMIGKSFGFAVKIAYVCESTIRYLISKAGLEEQALSKKLEASDNKATMEGNQ
jgi:ribosomal protein L10